MVDFKETAYNDLQGEDFGTFYSARKKWISKIKKYQKKYPNQVKIKHINKDGSLIAEIPQSWFKISPKKFVSEENRIKASKRLKKYREKQAEKESAQ